MNKVVRWWPFEYRFEVARLLRAIIARGRRPKGHLLRLLDVFFLYRTMMNLLELLWVESTAYKSSSFTFISFDLEINSKINSLPLTYWWLCLLFIIWINSYKLHCRQFGFLLFGIPPISWFWCWTIILRFSLILWIKWFKLIPWVLLGLPKIHHLSAGIEILHPDSRVGFGRVRSCCRIASIIRRGLYALTTSLTRLAVWTIILAVVCFPKSSTSIISFLPTSRLDWSCCSWVHSALSIVESKLKSRSILHWKFSVYY